MAISMTSEQVRRDPRSDRVKQIFEPEVNTSFRPGHARGWVLFATQYAAVVGWQDDYADMILARWIKPKFLDAWKKRCRSVAESAQSAVDDDRTSD